MVEFQGVWSRIRTYGFETWPAKCFGDRTAEADFGLEPDVLKEFGPTLSNILLLSNLSFPPLLPCWSSHDWPLSTPHL